MVISPDHWVNFFLNNLPAVCIGIGDEHDGPPEPFMQKVYPVARLKGHAAFGRHLLDTALDNDFEPALSHHLKLDHGSCIPLWRMGVDLDLPIVPIIINDLEEPMPSIHRCLAWGRVLRKAIESYPEPLRIAILGTGGLSHSIGETTMGWIDESFDHTCIKHFENGDEAPLAQFPHRRAAAHRQRRARNPRLGGRACGGRQQGFRADRLFPESRDAGGSRFRVLEAARRRRRTAEDRSNPLPAQRWGGSRERKRAGVGEHSSAMALTVMSLRCLKP